MFPITGFQSVDRCCSAGAAVDEVVDGGDGVSRAAKPTEASP